MRSPAAPSFVLVAALSIAVSAAGSGPGSAPAPPPAAPTGSTPAATPGSTPEAARAVAVHAAPIDCPLHGKNVDAKGLRPFEEVAAYIAFLDRPERAAWQRPDEVVRALGLAGTETVVDLGAGSGYFTFRLARALPRGRVVAIDVEPEMVRHVHHKVMTDEIPNVTAVLGTPDDPGVPAKADLVFVCDVLHHVANLPAWLGKLASETAPGTRVAVVEFKEGPLPQGPPEGAKLARATVLARMAAAGFALVSEDRELLPYQVLFVFRRA